MQDECGVGWFMIRESEDRLPEGSAAAAEADFPLLGRPNQQQPNPTASSSLSGPECLGLGARKRTLGVGWDQSGGEKQD